ncbi:uncharacterized protein LOC134816895 [Bolinopsis microptera]|uniref:uncharacterized protein LOC134816895 n=1 Tax=Bolinopsis microptera TaxID=2820187 RepID=UPI00307AABB7
MVTMVTTSNDPLDPNNCAGYYEGVPTLSLLLQYPPPEYFPLLIIGALIIVGNAVVSVIAWRRQLKFLEGATYMPAFRSMMIVASFGVFGVTSFAGLFSMRSSEYLHSIANTFEVFCILFFYENMCGLLRLNDFIDGTDKFILAVAPCCCCLRFLKPAPATEYEPFIK